MKNRKNNKNIRQLAQRFLIAALCAMLFCVSAPAAFGVQTGLVTEVQAAARISPTAKSLAVGQTSRIYISGTAGTPKWSTSNSKIVRVSSGGKIRALRPGIATITARVDGRKFSCKVTVKKNYLKLTAVAPRKTGFYDIGQSGNLIPSIKMQPVWIRYTASGALQIKFKFTNYSTFNWTKISKLRDVYIETKTGVPLIDIDPLTSSNAFSLAPGKSIYLTLTFKGGNVKKVVDLTKAKGIRYSADIYLKDAWR